MKEIPMNMWYSNNKAVIDRICIKIKILIEKKCIFKYPVRDVKVDSERLYMNICNFLYNVSNNSFKSSSLQYKLL